MALTTIGFDVDGTLIDFEDKPRYEIINSLLFFQNLGCRIVVGSGGGKEYAEMWCNKLGLQPNAIYDKHDLSINDDSDCLIDIWFDDEAATKLGKVNIKV